MSRTKKSASRRRSKDADASCAESVGSDEFTDAGDAQRGVQLEMPSESFRPPHVFISYAHEDESYRMLVQRLATKLRNDGVDAHLDAWHLDGRPFSDFMASEVRNADRILVLLSPAYRDGVHCMQDGSAASGRGWEAVLITSQLLGDYSKRDRLVLALARGTREESVPDSFLGFRCESLPLESLGEYDYLNLLEILLGRTAAVPPIVAKQQIAKPVLTPIELAKSLKQRSIAKLPSIFPRPPQLLNGSRFIGRFVISGFISRGGFSDAYLAWDTVRNMEVVLKLLVDPTSDPLLKRFIDREVRIARRLGQRLPNLVHTIEVIEVSNGACLVQERVEGESLWMRLQRMRVLPPSEALRIGICVCNAAARLHQVGLVHLDIKPINVMVASSGAATLIDLGTARSIGEPLPMELVVVSPPYSPVEVYTGAPATTSSDVYSIGMTVLHMLTDQETVFTDWNDGADFVFSMPERYDVSKTPSAEVLAMYVHDKLVHVSPPELRDVLGSALSPDGESRPSIHDLMTVLTSVAPV